MTLRVGIIGVGHLASYVVEGLCAANDPPDILLSPRNAERASVLSERFGVHTANDNRTVVSQSDIVILATRPPQALNAATDLPWRAEQTLICVAAGVSCAGLSTVASPARIAGEDRSRHAGLMCSHRRKLDLIVPRRSQRKVLIDASGTCNRLTRRIQLSGG
jgi:saccharopine dehydrogenase-like NADP-dependent oxidoreductase